MTSLIYFCTDLRNMALEDYKDIVAMAASITTIAQFFAGM
jgi:hypothetical protein